MIDGVISIVSIIMKMETEIATDSSMIVAIGIPGSETENLAKAVAGKCSAQKRGVLIAPLGHPLSVLIKLQTINDLKQTLKYQLKTQCLLFIHCHLFAAQATRNLTF